MYEKWQEAAEIKENKISINFLDSAYNLVENINMMRPNIARKNK